MIFDPVASLQQTLAAQLDELNPDSKCEKYGVVDRTVAWRPHLFERGGFRGWYFHFDVPEYDTWRERIARALKADPRLKAAVAAPLEVLRDADFMSACAELDASIAVIRPKRGEWGPETFHGSVADLIYERRLRLERQMATRLLDKYLAKAIAEPDNQRKGVLLEVVLALLFSQVDKFEVKSVGVSNRTQQMDLLVHNRNESGALAHSPVVLAEAKNWPKSAVTPTEYAEFLRKLKSRHGRAKLGYLVTTGRFTAGVGDERRRDSMEDTLVVLIDGKALPQLWRRREDITQSVEAVTIEALIGD